MSQAVLSELVNLSSMYLKANKVSLVAIGTHSERPIELLTSSRCVDRQTILLTTRKFGLFSLSEVCFKHFKCIIVCTKG